MNVQEILRLVGYPSDYLVLDFESYYDAKYSLSKMSAIEYIKDERWECLGCGFYSSRTGAEWFVKPDELTHFFIKSEQDNTLTNYINFNNYTVVAKNSKFDILVLKEVFGIVPPYIIDTEDLSRHLDSRDKQTLKHQAVKYKLGVKGDTADFKGLHWDDMDGTTRKDLVEYCLNDIDLERQLFELLLPQLTNPTLEVPLMRHTLDIYLHPMIEFDFVKADELKLDMHEEMIAVIAKTGHECPSISKDGSFKKILQDALPDGENVPVKQGKRGTIMALAQGDEGRKTLLEHPDEKVRDLMLARIAVRSWPLHIKRVTKLIAQATANGGKLAVPLKYYGGHTGRWSGAGGINLQNLGGKGRGKPIHHLIAAVRGLLRA
ncbi:hypothetical protein [Neptuniibacter sp.]|uniref:hypothetical protein n=1 Tax=Neptuniibacter sp. TaxID=1962643 RepID=UPI00262EC368|nr:hypothetical protein [Neptuniibacter sp.]MCP4596230.1 hypothetical protein [Neptuniibacter sp.]